MRRDPHKNELRHKTWRESERGFGDVSKENAELIDQFLRDMEVGLKISAMKMLMATDGQLEEHYLKDDEWLVKKGKSIIKNKGYPEDYDPKKAGREIDLWFKPKEIYTYDKADSKVHYRKG